MFLPLLATSMCTILLIFYWFPWLWDDVKMLSYILPTQVKSLMCCRKHKIFVNYFEHNAAKFADRTLLIFENKEYTFKDMDGMMNKVANAALSLGLKCDDCVCLFMNNSPQFIWTAYGLYKIGVRVALLNTNIRQKSLAHCVNESGASVIICGHETELIEAVGEIFENLHDVAVWVNTPDDDVMNPFPKQFTCFGKVVEGSAEVSETFLELRKNCHLHSTVGYIYTSGTTGLVKAVAQSNYRMFAASFILQICRKLGLNDVIYAPLPLYHSLAFLLGFGAAVSSGSAFLTCKRFSASRFWEECKKYDVTVVVYIGEMLRYLVSQDENPSLEKTHNVKMLLGNGLRRDIWSIMRDRFCIEKIVEIFAATEGNMGFINTGNVEGSVGRLSPLTKLMMPAFLVKYDLETEEPVRDENGQCIPVGCDSPGLLVTQISKITPQVKYHGKKGKDQSRQRLLHNVIKEGDTYFNFGDLLYCDSRYNLYFADRLGDTFRWKSENVSTTEVSNTLCVLDWVHDAAVYGVLVPGCEGRVGMAAVQLHNGGISLDSHQLQQLYLHSRKQLPSYGRPLFIRIVKKLDLTGTYKHKKTTLVSEGYDPGRVSDCLYFCDGKKETYVSLDKELFDSIQCGSQGL